MKSDHVAWLVQVPPTDTNFKTHLEKASAGELRTALARVRGKPGNKTRVRALERALRQREED